MIKKIISSEIPTSLSIIPQYLFPSHLIHRSNDAITYCYPIELVDFIMPIDINLFNTSKYLVNFQIYLILFYIIKNI